MVHNCTTSNTSTNSFSVRCAEGFNGGLPQSFLLEVRESNSQELRANLTSPVPRFSVTHLESGALYQACIYAYNDKGRSEAMVVQAGTLRQPEKQLTSEPGECRPPFAISTSLIYFRVKRSDVLMHEKCASILISIYFTTLLIRANWYSVDTRENPCETCHAALATLTTPKLSISFEQARILGLLESSKKVLAREAITLPGILHEWFSNFLARDTKSLAVEDHNAFRGENWHGWKEKWIFSKVKL